MLFLYDTIGQHVVQILASLILGHFLEPFYRLYKERQHTLEKRRLFFFSSAIVYFVPRMLPAPRQKLKGLLQKLQIWIMR